MPPVQSVAIMVNHIQISTLLNRSANQSIIIYESCTGIGDESMYINKPGHLSKMTIYGKSLCQFSLETKVPWC